MLRLLLLSLLLPLSLPAFAIYKCEADGKTTYSQTACPGGVPMELHTAAATDDGQTVRQQLVKDKKEADRLEALRHKREASEEKAQRKAARVEAARHKKCSALAQHKKQAADDVMRAKNKAMEQARSKARRAEEKYASECGSS